MAKKFSELRRKMSPESRALSAAISKKLQESMALDELRAARDLTQAQLAAALGVRQASISRMEHRADMYVSTLRGVIRAMGGDLEIRAVFPDGSVRITQFGHLKREKRKPVRGVPSLRARIVK